ncbi:MAG TPA: ferritin-like domain-containing protein [Longimicrobiales bacterium]|nr:ferritin-like domain-containing protein [Longimicrobiales bacterium]
MKLDDLRKLYVHELKDLYSAEQQLLEALPKMERAASDGDLKQAFASHLKETQRHVQRLEDIFSRLEFEPGGQRCAGMEGLIEEAADMMKEDAPDSVKDAGLIAAAQRVEHYEIAGYGVVRTYAEKLGDYRAADILQDTLNEEGLADQKLSRIAMRRINFEALTS